jgi:hypothetical protein
MLLTGLALVQAAAVAALPPAPAPPVASAVGQSSAPRAYLTDDDLLLFSVELDQLTLTETLTAHGDPDDPLLPVGELARLLDLDVDVFPADRRISGTLGQARRPLIVDLNSGLARVNGNDIHLQTNDVGLTQADIYIRSSVLQRILPVRFAVDSEGLSIKLTALEKLPIEERMERLARMRGSGSGISDNGESTLKLKSPYALFSPPAVDVAVEGGRDTRTLQTYHGRYDIRLAGDLFYSNLQAYLGSDDRGRPNSARVLLERRSNSGALPLGATRISAGDVFTPMLAMGPRSIGGRGFSFTTAPLEQASVFDTIDLRGELPIGYDVELYINDVLRGGQRSPVQGRYEFLNVPLVRGINVIRIVTYGPRGERNEIVRVMNVGGGQLAKHQTQFDFGIVDQGRALIEPTLSPADVTGLDARGPRLVASAAYGLSDRITLVSGFGLYSVAGGRGRRDLVTAGVRTSLAGFAVQMDSAADSKGGGALGFGLAGQLFGVSTLLQHMEYRGGFIDENVTSLDFSRTALRHTSLTLDFSLPAIAHKRIPLSLRALRDQFADGGTSYVADARASATLFDTLVSSAFDYVRETQPGQQTSEHLLANLSASKFIDFKWQLRASADYQLLPVSAFKDLSVTADRSLSDELALRLGLGKTLGPDGDTFGQAGGVLKLPIGELSLTGDYSLSRHQWALSARLGFGSLFDPIRRRYVLTPPGPASGGSAVFHAFLDNDGDGQFSSGDQPISKVSLEGGQRPAVTDASGTAVVTGLGSGPTAALRVGTRDIDEFYVGSSATRIEFPPRPGKVVSVPYPIEPVGEIYARFFERPAQGPPVGISALQVRIVRDGHKPIEASTEYDGSVVFSDVPLGTYRLELDPAQAARLGMSLDKKVTLTVTADRDAQVEATVIFKRKEPDGAEPVPVHSNENPK